MQKLSSGIGDLKRLGFVRSSSDGSEQPPALRTWRWKAIALIGAVLLAWGVLHVVLSEIISTHPPGR